MKTITIITNENNRVTNSIQKYFEGKDIEINMLNDITKVDISNLIVTLYKYPQENIMQLSKNLKIINLHQSLLPSFQTINPLYEALKYGVKVTGITIHNIEPDNFYGRILAQYPILIGLTSHFDTIQKEMEEVSSKLYPVVIDRLLRDEVFDYTDLFKNSCLKCNKNCNS